jgi:DnaK suppressor protein
MTKTTLEKLKKKLVAERDSLNAKLLETDLQMDDAETPDPVDLAVRNYSKNVAITVTENDSRQLQMVNEALARIDNKEYGLCLNCEEKITQKRLEAIPWARYCLKCQELVEQGMIDED